jgi:hypothetical protein
VTTRDPSPPAGRIGPRMGWLPLVLAWGYAAVSAYWAAGGTAGIDTVGGQIAELARSGSPAAALLAWAATVAKLIGGLLGVAMARRQPPGRLVLGLAWCAAVVLCGYGGAQVLAGVLVETGLLRVTTPVDHTALRWHLALWDLWFLVWGIALTVAVASATRRRRLRSTVDGQR